MDFLSVHAWIGAGVIVACGVIVAPIVRAMWVLRLLMASYLALCLVLLMPEKMMFSEYASGIYFGVLATLFTFVENGRFFDVTGWNPGRFSVHVFIIGAVVAIFFCAILCSLVPYILVASVVPQDLFNFLAQYVFYCAIVPIIYIVLFGRRI